MPEHAQTPEHPALLILNAVKLHEKKAGISSIARILKGSKSKRIFDRKLYESKLFGALFYHPVDVIENFIKQLIQQEYLTTTNISYKYPIFVLQLTATGHQAIQQRQNIPLQIIHITKPLHITPSLQQTVDLFNQLKNIPYIAEQRKLAQSTIWGHMRDAVKLSMLKPTDIIKPEKIQLIRETKKRLNIKGLKEIKEALPKEYLYEEIIIALHEEKP